MNAGDWDSSVTGPNGRLKRSVQPIRDPQARNLGEVGGITGEQRGVVCKGDASDFQIHRANTHALTAKMQESICAVGVPWEDHPTSVKLQATLQSGVGWNLGVRVVMRSMDLGKPAAQLFLGGNNRRCDFLANG